MTISNLRSLVAASVGGIVLAWLCIDPAMAASYRQLTTKGFKTGNLIQSSSGQHGWQLTKGDEKYFCRAKLSLVYVGKNGLVGFTASGRQVKMDRAAYDKAMGGTDPTIPQMADLKAGRPKSRHVGRCQRLRN